MLISNNFILFILLILLTLALVISTIRTYDRTTYLLEIIPALIALPILISADKKYPLTRLIYTNNLGIFINLVKKTASQSTGYFFIVTTNQSHRNPCTGVTLQAP